MSLGTVLRRLRLPAAALLLAAAARAQEPAAGQAPPSPEPPADVRSALAARGGRVELVLTGEAWAVPAGGRAQGGRALGEVDLKLRLDLERLAGWRGASALLAGAASGGGDPSALAADLQGVSNLAARQGFHLVEAWWQQNLLQGHLSLLLGIADLNAEFYVLPSAGLFLNGSPGLGKEYSSSGLVGPSTYPNTALAGRIEVRPRRGIVLRAALADAAPFGQARPAGAATPFSSSGGALLTAEGALLALPPLAPDGGEARARRLRAGRAALGLSSDAKLAVGGWYYTGRFDDLAATDASGAPLVHRGSGGFYAIGEATLARDPRRPGRRLRAFGQLGFGDGRVNDVWLYAGTGLVASGALPSRPDDEVGVLVATAWVGDAYRQKVERAGGRTVRAEVALEATWLLALAPWLAVQPDVQVVVNPAADPAVPNAVAAGARVELSL